MKKIISMILAICSLMPVAFGQDAIFVERHVAVNDKVIDATEKCLVIDGYTYYPVEKLCENADITLSYSDDGILTMMRTMPFITTFSATDGPVDAKYEKVTAVIDTKNNTAALMSDMKIDFNTKLIDSTVYIPLRELCGILGMSISWDEVNKTVNIVK